MSAPRFYRTQLVKGGPIVGLKIWRGHPVDPDTGETLTERPCIWRAECNGIPEPIEDVAPWIADGTGDSVRGVEVDEAEYKHLSTVADWARTYAPEDPAAKPREKVDLTKMAPIKW